jgi:hypothetical protein
VPSPIPEEEEKQIADALRAGKKPDQIHKETGRGKSVIYRIMESIGLSNGPSGPTVRTKKANEVKSSYSRERRLELNDRFFKRLEGFVEQPITARDFKELMVAYGILEDKRSLLEPIIPEGTKTGLEEMREHIHKSRQERNGMETSPGRLQGG